MRWTYVGGTFDLFHAGHVEFLRKVRHATFGAPLVVALNTDEFAGRYKRPPVMSLAERWATLESNLLVDKVVTNWGDEDSWETVTRLCDEGIQIGKIAHGDDWVGPTLMRQMNLTYGGMAGRGIELLHVPYTKGISSTDIQARIVRRWQDENARAQVPFPRETAAVCCGGQGDRGDCSCA